MYYVLCYPDSFIFLAYGFTYVLRTVNYAVNESVNVKGPHPLSRLEPSALRAAALPDAHEPRKRLVFTYTRTWSYTRLALVIWRASSLLQASYTIALTLL